jgi:hydroxymethylbilane synthase
MSKIGGDGVFVVEIERALQDHRIDVGVHSLKDLPTAQPYGLRILVPGQREDARDVLIARSGVTHPLDATTRDRRAMTLRLGTCSLRRTAQARVLFPQAEIISLRGNVDTRLRKLDAGEYDAIILAAAGLHRLGLAESLSNRLRYFSLQEMLPAPGQGALGLETRDDPELLALLQPLHDAATQATTSAERMFMRRLGAGCYLPVAAYAQLSAGQLSLTGLVSTLDGFMQVNVSHSQPWHPGESIEHAEAIGIGLAEVALAQGAGAIIDELTGQLREQQHI